MEGQAKTIAMGIGATLTLPLLILNWTSGVVGGLWLGFNREWGLLLGGMLIMLFGHLIISILMLVGVAIVAVGVKVKWAILRYPLLALTFLANFSVIVGWAVGCFSLTINRPHASILPYLLWGYALATVPWVTMARQESSEGTIMWLSATQFGALAILISVLVGNGYQTEFAMRVFFVPAALLGMGISFMMHRAARY